MKKLLMLLFAAVLAFCLCGCDSKISDSLEMVEATENVGPDYRQIYYDAVQKTESENRYGYDFSISDLLTYPDEENIITTNGHVELSGSDCYAEIDDSENSVNFSYVDGYIYSDESGGNFKAPMAEAEFNDYLDGYVYPVVGAEFMIITGTENDDGTHTVSLGGMEDLPEALAKRFQELGMSDVVLHRVSGKAEIDENGYIDNHVITAELSMRDSNEAAVKYTFSAEMDYIIGGEHGMPQIAEDDYVTVDDMNIPMLIKKAYESLVGTSYNASYESLYNCSDGSEEYSMELNYSQSVTELPVGFEASDETVIKYDTANSGRTVEKSSEYSMGECESINGDSYYTEDMTDASARSMYHQMLMDYEPDMNLIRNIGIKDFGEYYEIEYEYADENAILYCQNVLTALIDDQEGIAVHSEDHTIENAVSTMRINKDSGALIIHEIDITATFNDGERNFDVGFEHTLRVGDSAILEVKNVEAKAGDVVEVDVYLENNPGAAAIAVDLDFDTNVFTAVSVTPTEELLHQGSFTTETYGGVVKAEGSWIGEEYFYDNGKIMTFTFQINENASADEYAMTLNGHVFDLVNEELEDIEVTYLNGKVMVYDNAEQA